MSQEMETPERTGLEIAVIGMAGRFPGANNVKEFWRNLRAGVESITFFSEEELLASGVRPELLANPNYVKASPIIEGTDQFAASFFGYSPRDAATIDPQQRLFLECSWQAMEDAGYAPGEVKALTGVFGGSFISNYLIRNLVFNPKVSDPFLLEVGNEKDYLATRVAYKLDLGGPTVNASTACSTSLVTVHLACQSLLSGECDMALAGGVNLHVPMTKGYVYRQGAHLSPDGHCRSFDHRAGGTNFGSGLGIVVLKRLENAIEDGDAIRAILLGTAMNNDGAGKVGFSAPGLDGQVRVVKAAHAAAEVDPETISYVEAHGTATPIGDPIEVRALSRAFNDRTRKKGFCGIGSNKSNIGHLGTAAGIASLIKTVLALEHEELPPTINFEQPNPEIDFENSPFYVQTELAQWSRNGAPRRAGVSSFGMGGTNAHAVLEEAPERPPSGPSRPEQLVLLSAQTDTALEEVTRQLTDHLEEHPEQSFADVAYTLHVGRKAQHHRRVLVCRDRSDALAALGSLDPRRVFSTTCDAVDTDVTFLFSGQGSQYARMGEGLYKQESVFRHWLDRGAEILESHLDLDLRQVLFPRGDGEKEAEQLGQTQLTQPALFVVEYALARLWMDWGIQPQSMIGHSIGEYVAACLADVFTFEDALGLVAVRGRLMQSLAPGSMLGVNLPADELEARLDQRLALAATNGPARSVISGPSEAVAQLRDQLTAESVVCRDLHTSHAFHSAMMDPILEPFLREVEKVERREPQIPYLSNLTGTWIRPAEATDAEYWTQHLRHAVRFSEGLEELYHEDERILLEVGPGRTLRTLASQHPKRKSAHQVFSSLRHPKEKQGDGEFLLGSVGDLWMAGAHFDWNRFYAGETRYRLSLPTYPFERQSFWVDPDPSAFLQMASPTLKNENLAEWFYLPFWKPSSPPLPFEPESVEAKSVEAKSVEAKSVEAKSVEAKSVEAETVEAETAELQERWLIFADGQADDRTSLASALGERFEKAGHQVFTVHAGDAFTRHDAKSFSLRAAEREDYETLIEELGGATGVPHRMVHLWTFAAPADVHTPATSEKILDAGFYSLLCLAQALGKHDVTDPLELNVVSSGLHRIRRSDPLVPEKAAVLGPCRVIPREYANIVCRSIDIGSEAASNIAGELASELVSVPNPDPRHQVVAYRDGDRWLQAFENAPIDAEAGSRLPLRSQGVYLITGGLGGLGLVFARHLAETYQARLVLTGRSALPEKSTWDSWIQENGANDSTSRKISVLRELEEAGAETLLVAADVTDEEQMAGVVNAARQRFGTLHGVIHAAGVAGGGMIQRKTRDVAAAVLAAKVQGTRALIRALEQEPLDCLVLCSSVASMLGGVGQVDYCAANNVLDALAHEARATRPDVQTVAINWGPWDEVGMAVNTDLPQLRRPGGQAATSSEATDTGHLLLGRCVSDTPERQIFVNEFRVEDLFLLSEHRILGTPAIPGTTYLEMARAAHQHRTGEAAGIALEDVLFFTPMMVQEGEVREVQTSLERKGDAFEFRAISRLEQGGEVTQHALIRLRPLGEISPRQWQKEEILGRCERRVEVEKNLHPEGSPVSWGDHWQCLKHVDIGKDEGLAWFEMPPEFAAETASLAFHPVLFDVATSLASFGAADFYLPLTYRRIHLHRPLPARFYAHVHNQTFDLASKDMISADLTIFDEQGAEIVEVEHFTQKRVGEAANRLEQNSEPAQTSPKGAARPSSATAASAWVDPSNDKTVNPVLAGGGIAPQEGVAALRRVLSRHRGPQIVATCKDLLAQLEAIAQARGDNPAAQDNTGTVTAIKHDRPSNLRSTYVAPRNETETVLVEVWQELLSIGLIGVHDNFYELGGDSVVGIQVVAQARQQGVEFSPNLLFEHLTVAELAEAISGGATSETAEEQPYEAFPIPDTARPMLDHLAAEHGQIEDVYPLTPLQQGLLLEGLEASESGLYVEVIGQPFEGGELNQSAFEQAWHQIVARHATLRTGILWEGLDEPLQVVYEKVDVPFHYYDWRELPPDEQSTKLTKFRKSEGGRNFDLTQAPLMRVSLVHLSETSHYLVWTHHHAVTDGWSSLVVTNEALQYYQAFASGGKIDKPVPRPYRDFVTWMRRQDLEAAENFWRSTLAGFGRANTVGTARADGDGDGDGQEPSYGDQAIRVSAATSTALVEMARSHQLTLNSVVQGAWSFLLCRASGSTDVVYGVTVSGRPAELEGSESTVGLFINTLPLRVRVDPESTVSAHLGEIQSLQARILEHSHTPLAQVQAWSEVPHGQPLFETSYQFWNFPGLPSKVESRNFRYEIKTHYPLLVRAIPGDELVLQAVYDHRLFADEHIEQLLARFESVLRGFTERPEETLSAFTALLDEEDKEAQGEKAKKAADSARDKLKNLPRRRPRA